MDWKNYGPEMSKRVREELRGAAVKDVSTTVFRDGDQRRAMVTVEYEDGTVVADKVPVSLPDVAAPVAAIAARIKAERSRKK